MLIRAFTFKIDNATAVSMLNTVYAIFLGLLFTFFLSLETPDTNKPSNISNKNGIAPAAINKNVANLEPSSPTGITLKLYINSKNCLPVILMSLYFLFDWFSCNLTMIIKNKDIHHWLVIVLIVIITYLGVIVVLSFVSNLIFYIGFALYALIVPWWDIRLKDMELQGGKSVV